MVSCRLVVVVRALAMSAVGLLLLDQKIHEDRRRSRRGGVGGGSDLGLLAWPVAIEVLGAF